VAYPFSSARAASAFQLPSAEMLCHVTSRLVRKIGHKEHVCNNGFTIASAAKKSICVCFSLASTISGLTAGVIAICDAAQTTVIFRPLEIMRGTEALAKMDRVFAEMYEADIKGGRPNIALEKLLRNTARGELIDERALYDALQSGRVSAAGLDVFALEPAGAGNPLLSLPNVIATPHIAWLLPETLERSIGVIVENGRRLRDGEPLLNRVG
jgi:hypothetical protein